MKKNLFLTTMLVAGCLSFASCDKNNNDDEPQLVDDETQSALVCVEQIIDGCCDIANEVGNAKIGDPYDLWNSGQQTKALYAVESWYSWHSIDDYSNNILSVRNAAGVEGSHCKLCAGLAD